MVLFQRNRVKHLLSVLHRDHQLFVGTPSWRYLGWCGTLYDEDRYLWGNHFSKKRFHEHCLEEYAEVFPSVEVDSTYYALPKTNELKAMASQVPGEFRFSFKVTDTITIKNFPNLKSFGNRAGQVNEFFLDDQLFKMGFLRPLETFREQVGMVVFEFSHFDHDDFEHGREFVEALDQFFGKVPPDWPYGVEIRNPNLLHPEHFSMLKRHGVAHVYNQWTAMPSVSEQLKQFPVGENPFLAARFLLTPGRDFRTARARFEPFNRLQEIDTDARQAMVELARHAIDADTTKKPGFIYVGNDLEGNALHTLSDLLETIEDFED